MGDKQKILITGINGFVGSAVGEELQKARKFEIYGLVGKNKKGGFDRTESKGKVFQTDISDEKTLCLADDLKNTDIIIHSAGLAHQFGRVSKDSFWDVNVLGTENICRLAKATGVRHFILISSVAVYGASAEGEIDETSICRPLGIYAESKVESENRAIEFCEKKRIPLTILRLATVIGEGDRGNTARLITAIDKNRFLWVGKGENKKSLIYRGDAARGIRKVVESGKSNGAEVYNLTGETISVREIVEEISRNLQKRVPRLEIPGRLTRAVFLLNKTGIAGRWLGNFEATLEKWLSDDVFSGAKFDRNFNFKPGTPIREALAKEVKHYLKQKRGLG